jgi:hypothetical protein
MGGRQTAGCAFGAFEDDMCRGRAGAARPRSLLDVCDCSEDFEVLAESGCRGSGTDVFDEDLLAVELRLTVRLALGGPPHAHPDVRSFDAVAALSEQPVYRVQGVEQQVCVGVLVAGARREDFEPHHSTEAGEVRDQLFVGDSSRQEPHEYDVSSERRVGPWKVSELCPSAGLLAIWGAAHAMLLGFYYR